MRRRCLGLIRPYLDETAHLGSLETWSDMHIAVLSITPVATDTVETNGQDEVCWERMLDSSQAPGSEGSLHERAMLAVVHCTVTAMLNLQTEHQAWPAKSISIVTLNNSIELASVVGTAARAAHVVCVIASDESKLGRPADMQTAASPTSKSNGDISAREWLHAQPLSVLRLAASVQA
jgi:hypothetical protein